MRVTARSRIFRGKVSKARDLFPEKRYPRKGGLPARAMTEAPVTIQITPTSLPSMPTFMGEVATFAQVLTHEGTLKAIADCRAVHGTVLAETNRPIVQPCPADLSALDQLTVEALRTLFQKDLLARSPFSSLGGLFDRTGGQWLVIDVDGTRQAARKPALPQTEALPAPHRRFEAVCAPGYLGR